MIQVKNSTIHYINERALTFSENDLNDPQRVAVSLVSGTVIMAYVPGTIDYAADGNYERWTLKGYSTKLVNDAAHYIYARLSRTDRTSLIVFSVKDYNIDGSITTVTGKDENGNDITETTDPSADYFYIKIGELTATDGTSSRELTYDSGLLNTKKGDEESSLLNELWELIKGTNPLIRAKYWLTDFVVKGFVTFIGGFKFSKGKEGDEKIITDIKRSIDSDEDVPISDESIPTTKYIQSVSDDKYLRKDQPDQTDYLIKFLGGLEVGEAIESFLLGKGTIITPDGRIQADRIEVRQSMTVMDLIINQLQGIAADYLFSDVGKVDSVTEIADRTYVLHIEKKTDFDFTTLGHGDILHMIVNDLYKGGGNYFSSWMRVLSVDTDANDVTVVLYDDDQVQGGSNFAPVAGYNVARRGNVIVPDEGETNERANYWMLSSREGRIQFLQNMFKPTIEDYNYALTIGKLPDIKAIRHLPVTPNKDVGLVAQTAIVENLYQFDYNGDIVPKIVDRGNWSLAVAQSESPYRFFDYEREYPDGETTYTVLEQHSVWHNGMRFRCLKDKTTEEPKWNSTDWAMMDEYELEMRFTSSEGNAFHAGKVDTEITPSVYLGNIDISDDIAVLDWIWTYELGEYNGRVLHLTNELMPPNWSRANKAKFTCTAYVRKSEDDVTPVSNVVTI